MMADSWATSATRRAQRAKVKAGIVPDDGPWDRPGNLRLPAWLEGAPPMPELWPVFHFWMMAGREALRRS
jgi:hypothetical protein